MPRIKVAKYECLKGRNKMRSVSRSIKKSYKYIITAVVSALVILLLIGVVFPTHVYDKSIPAENIILDAQTQQKTNAKQTQQQDMTEHEIAVNDTEPPDIVVSVAEKSTVSGSSSSPSNLGSNENASTNNDSLPAISSNVADPVLPSSSKATAETNNSKAPEEPKVSIEPIVSQTAIVENSQPTLNLNAQQADQPEASANSNQSDSQTKTVEESTEQPPSVLDIISRSIFSYKTLLSREMPFIYGTEYIAQDIDSLLDEQETAPDDITEEIQLEISKLKDSKDTPQRVVTGGGAQVLIYHTHTLEAFRQVKGSEYVEAGSWRTKDQTKSVVEVGDLLQKELEKYGYDVLHDKTNHEPPELNTAYSRSLSTMKKYLKNNKTLRVFIDLHRDASTNKNDVVTIDGKRCARVMFVVGMGKSSSIKPDWKNNFKLAQTISSKLNEIAPTFARDVRIKEIRSYNQYLTDLCMLIEVGHNANTLEEAENTIPYLAKAINEVITLKK
jgi:stage II sporulation protein P